MEIMSAEANQPRRKVAFGAEVCVRVCACVCVRGGLLFGQEQIIVRVSVRFDQAKQQRVCRDMEECWR